VASCNRAARCAYDAAVHERFAAVIDAPVAVLRRDDRWIALGDEIVAMVCDDPQRQAAEAWLLARWRAGGVPAPRVVAERAGVQIRERLHGITGEALHREAPDAPMFVALPDVRARLVSAPLSAFGVRVAESYGALAARIRRAVDPADATMLGVASPRTLDVEAALAAFAASAAPAPAKRIAARRRAWIAAVPPADAVIHGDLHFHNLCAAPDGTITGVWDLGGAGHDAASSELCYIASLGREFAACVIAAYGGADADAVDRAHVRAALGHVLYHRPGMPRHDDVVAWATAVLDALG
jgi:aminoglycoside phosphotransferase (APT) family kinase protein